MPDQDTQPTQPLSPGEKLNQFEVVEELGSGGSSIVFKAYDAVLDRHVAIKQLLTDQTDEIFRQRFRQEAEIQRRISDRHPGVVKLIDVVDNERGLFLILEFVQGATLEQQLAQTGDPIEPRQVVRILFAVGKVLQAIHAEGVIHRDLKPSNILLPDGGQPVIKVCDLGLATLMTEQEAMSLGSVRYMAPELFDPQASVTGQADLYAVGMIAYEMLIGRKAFDQEFKTILRDQRSQAMRWMKWHTNFRLKTTPAVNINSRVPLTLSELVARMLEKEPAKRVASAEELCNAIQRHFGRKDAQPPDTSTASRDLLAQSSDAPLSTVGDTARLPSQKRWALWAAVVGVMLFMVALAYVVLSDNGDQAQFEQRTAEAQQLLQEARDAYLGDNLVQARNRYQFLLDEYGQSVDPQYVREGQAGLMLVNTKLHLDAGRLAEASQSIETLQQLKLRDVALIHELEKEVEARQMFRDQMEQITQALDAGRLGDARVRLDAFRNAQLSEQEAAQVEQMRERLQGQLTQRETDRQLKRVDAAIAAGNREQAMQQLRQLAQTASDPRIDQKLGQLQQSAKLEKLMAQARNAQEAGNLTEAIVAYRQALQLRPSEQVEQTIVQLQLADVLGRAQQKLEAGDVASARMLYLQATDLDPDNAEAKRQLSRMDLSDRKADRVKAGDIALHSEQYDTAIRHYEAALELNEDADVETKLQTARLRRTLEQARQAREAGRLEDAAQFYTQALDMDPSLTLAQTALSEIATRQQYERLVAQGDRYRRQSKYSEASAAYRDARDVLATEEIQNRIDDLEFEQLISRTRGLIATKRYEAAGHMLRTAAERPRADAGVIEQVQKEIDQAKEDAPTP